MVLEIPDGLKRLEAPMRELFAELTRQIGRVERGVAANYEEFEGRLAERLAAVERGAHAATLAALDVDAAAGEDHDAEYVRVGHADRTYMTQAGPVLVAGRALYRRVGARNEQGRRPRHVALGRGRGCVASRCCPRDGALDAAGDRARGGNDGGAARALAVLALELRSRGARRREALPRAAPGHRRAAHRRARSSLRDGEHQRLAGSRQYSDGGSLGLVHQVAREGAPKRPVSRVSEWPTAER